jgi:hypothetical protein
MKEETVKSSGLQEVVAAVSDKVVLSDVVVVPQESALVEPELRPLESPADMLPEGKDKYYARRALPVERAEVIEDAELSEREEDSQF